MYLKKMIVALEFLDYCENHIGLASEMCLGAKITYNQLYEMVINNPDLVDVIPKFKKDFDRECQKLENEDRLINDS